MSEHFPQSRPIRKAYKAIEFEGGIVNIRTGLKDSHGRRVVHIEIIPDDHYAGEPKWKLLGCAQNRLVELKKRHS